MQVDRAAGPSVLDAVRNGRGCDVELLSRLGEALAAGRGFEEAQTFKRRKGLHGPQSAKLHGPQSANRNSCLFNRLLG